MADTNGDGRVTQDEYRAARAFILARLLIPIHALSGATGSHSPSSVRRLGCSPSSEVPALRMALVIEPAAGIRPSPSFQAPDKALSRKALTTTGTLTPCIWKKGNLFSQRSRADDTAVSV